MKELIERIGIQKVAMGVILLVIIILLSIRYDRGIREFDEKTRYDETKNWWGASRRSENVNLYDVKMYLELDIKHGGADIRIDILDENKKEVKCIYEESFDGEQKISRTIDVGDIKGKYSLYLEVNSRDGLFDIESDYEYKMSGLGYVASRWFGYGE